VPPARRSVTICSGLYFFIGIPASLQSEFSLTPAGTKNPGHVSFTTVLVLMNEAIADGQGSGDTVAFKDTK